jgi:hypothetical protein
MTKDEQIKYMANPNRSSVGVQEARPQRTWDELTLAEMTDAYNKHAKYQIEDMGVSGWVDFAAAIEAKLRRNT